MKRALLTFFTLLYLTLTSANPDLDITEIMYNPPTGIGGCNGDQCEYIEITNTGTTDININGFQLMDGEGADVDLTFPDITLMPGEMVIVTRNLVAFTAAYVNVIAVQILEGLPSLTNNAGSNPNNEGETLTIIDPNNPNPPCSQITYNVSVANGNGKSLHFDKDGNPDPLPLGEADPTPGNGAPLPVELLFFSGELQDDQVLLSWATASEINNDYFAVETSISGKGFEEIARIAGAGNSSTEIYYEHLHNQPVEGNNYYRLKQTDFDGSVSYSDIIVVRRKKMMTMSIQPTVARQEVRLNLLKGYPQDSRIEVFSSYGAKVMEVQLPAQARQRSINIGTLPNGHYFVSLNKTKTMRFVKI